MKLSELVENPDNPSVATDEDIKRLKGKLERVPKGLTAMRIAYVTDKIDGKKMVISGNKRLRVLKEQFGEDAELPDEYFQDVTSMSEAERHEFIVTANISDGTWDIQKLLAQYDIDILSSYGMDDIISQIPSDMYNQISTLWEIDTSTKEEKNAEKTSVEETKLNNICRCRFCGKEFNIDEAK